jgi:F420-non-reducing hydrogenase small subunit
MAVRVVSEWLNSCSGCEISILNLGEVILDLIPDKLALVHIPALVDSKYYGPTGEAEELSLPDCEVALISGGVRSEEHLEVAREARKRAGVVIALGTCATHGGIPAQANAFTNAEIEDKVFKGCLTTPPVEPPTEVIPKWLDRVYALNEVIDVDISIPGCAPHPDWIADALLALLGGGTAWSLPERSVCDTCKVKRTEKTGAGRDVLRAVTRPEFDPETGTDDMVCLMEQGFLCLGAVTLAGCAGKAGNARCIEARLPCRGCFGPIRDRARPLSDMMGSLASVGFRAGSVDDRRLMMNRFIGGHDRLVPLHRSRKSEEV